MQEVKDGLLDGPISEDGLRARVGPLWVAARRFGLKHWEKIRAVDDFFEFGTNLALSLLSLDNIVARARALLSSVNKEGELSIIDNLDK